MSRSRTLATGLSKEIGRYEELLWTGLPGLGIAIILADFQTAGMEAEDTAIGEVEIARVTVFCRSISFLFYPFT